jgi:hypothetical protein
VPAAILQGDRLAKEFMGDAGKRKEALADMEKLAAGEYT